MMEIQQWSIERVIPYPRNARKISDRAVDKVAASIKEFGWRQPIVVDKDGVIIVGHVRHRAAQKLGFTHVPVHVADNLTPAQVKAYRLMDNRSNDETAWDPELLGVEIAELKGMEIDLALTGLDPRELDALVVDPAAAARAEETPALPENPVSMLGDLWLLGSHRVLCGDSTSEEAVSRLFAAGKGVLQPRLMVTDPPYGVEYDPAWRDQYNQTPSPHKAFVKANRNTGKVSNDDQADWSPAWRLFPGDVAYVWHAGIYAAEVATSLLAAEFQMRAQIIWRKQHFVMSRGAYHWQHEPCWYAERKGKTANWRGDRKQTTIWDVPNLNPMGGSNEAATGHGTQKPIEIMRRPIINHSDTGELVYDPFLGSGTTLMAAHLSDRICVGNELDPKYVDVIVRRWQDYTGEKAVLDGARTSFAKVRDERLGKLQAV
jgi:DNA modification methylase